jgi:hypothetical protein
VSRQLETVVEALDRIPAGSGEEPLLALIGQGQQAVTITAGMVLRAIQRGIKLAGICAEAKQFLCPENVAALENWGRDARNTVGFSVRQTGSQVTIVLADRSRATLSTAWPKAADLSRSMALATAGMQLDRLLPRRTTPS